MITFIIGEIFKVIIVIICWNIGRRIYDKIKYRNEETLEQIWDNQIRLYLGCIPEAYQAIIVNKEGHVIHTVDRKEL